MKKPRKMQVKVSQHQPVPLRVNALTANGQLGAWDAVLLAMISLVLMGIAIVGLAFAALVIWAIL